MNKQVEQRTKVGASALILDTAGRVLIGKRSDDDPSMPGLWCTPGGGVEFRETVDDAIVRECQEEVGLEVLPCGQAKFVERITDEKHTVMFFKRALVIGGEPRALDGFSEIKWIGSDEFDLMAARKELTPSTEEGLKAFDVRRGN